MDISYFQQKIDRRHTDSCKWDEADLEVAKLLPPGTDVSNFIHLGCADADFKSPECVNQAVHALADYGLYGYTNIFSSFKMAVVRWMAKHKGVRIPEEWVTFVPRINITLGLLVRGFTQKGDSVLIHSPYYPPLKQAAAANGCEVLEVPLIEDGDSYALLISDLERAVQPNTKIMVLVNPHNPTTRIWRPDELRQVATFCVRHKLILFVDEIHSDLVSFGHYFTSALSLLTDEQLEQATREQLRDLLMVANSPAKTFNTPGAVTAYVISASPRLQQVLSQQLQIVGEVNPNIFGNALLKAAYNSGAEYVFTLNQYIDINADYFAQEFSKIFPKAKIKRREGTYLLWIDMRPCFKDEAELKAMCLKAQVWFNFGSHFGEQFSNHIRVNLATPHDTLQEVLSRLAAVTAGK